VLTLAEADVELQRFNFLKKQHTDEQFLARRNVGDVPAAMERLSKHLADLQADAATAKAHAADRIIIVDTRCLHDDAPAVWQFQFD